MFGPGPQGGFYNALAMGQQTGNNVMNAFMQGRQMAEQRNERNALAAYAKDPNEANFAGLADVRPDIAIQQREAMAAREAKANIAQIGQAALNGDNEALGQLFTLDNDLWKRLDERQRGVMKETTGYMAQRALQIGRLPEEQRASAWQQSVQEAERGGIDIPAYLESYTPGVIDNVIARAGITEKYIQQFEPDFRVIPQGGYLEDVNPLTSGQQQQAPQQQANTQAATPAPVPRDMFEADVASLGLDGAIRFAVSKGLAVPITGDAEFAALPSGAAFVGPDGLMRRKP
jgi:hypothetical protein